MRLRKCVSACIGMFASLCACTCVHQFLSECLVNVPVCPVCVSVCDCLWTPWERPWEDNGTRDAWEFGLMCRWWVVATDSHWQPNSSSYNARIWTHLTPIFARRLLMGTQVYHLWNVFPLICLIEPKTCRCDVIRPPNSTVPFSLLHSY